MERKNRDGKKPFRPVDLLLIFHRIYKYSFGSLRISIWPTVHTVSSLLTVVLLMFITSEWYYESTPGGSTSREASLYEGGSGPDRKRAAEHQANPTMGGEGPGEYETRTFPPLPITPIYIKDRCAGID